MQNTQPSKPEAVLVALNAPRESDNPFAKTISPPRLMTDANANITKVMKQSGIRKIVTMAAFGVGDSYQNANFLVRLMISKSNMKVQFEDHGLVDQDLKKSGLDYVLVRPAMLKGEEALPVKEYGNNGKGTSFMPSISRRSVAVFMLDAVEKDRWNGSTPVISN